MGSADTHKGIAGHLAKFSGCDVIDPGLPAGAGTSVPGRTGCAESVYLALINHSARLHCAGGRFRRRRLSVVLAMRLREQAASLSFHHLFFPKIDLTQQQLYQPECEPVLHASWTFKANAAVPVWRLTL